MSLPNYLLEIKSSGIYRFVWDKSQVPPQTAETLRLVVGYSEKGPFNTPVYITSKEEFIRIYGNISKRLEKRGIFFHRTAIQALQGGPILALNLKPFTNESVEYINFNASSIMTDLAGDNKTVKITDLYNTNRFWVLDEDQLPTQLKTDDYITIAATDNLSSSCTVFIKKSTPRGYDLTLREWYTNNTSVEMPDYLEPIIDTKLNNYFADIYVFKGQFTKELCSGDGPLAKYCMVEEGEGGNTKISVHKTLTIFGEEVDGLEAMANDSNSNFIANYTGCLLPYFKDANGNYISLDILFNSDYASHKMLMKLDESKLDESADIKDELGIIDNEKDYAHYIKGYTYESITKVDTEFKLQTKILNQLLTKGILTALTNNVDVNYHYIVDSFKGYPVTDDSNPGCKSILAYVAMKKDNAFALINFPSMNDFAKQPAYVGDDGRFDIKLVADKFPMISESNGASWCAYFTPVVISDGTLKTVIPSAGLVSNNFIYKYEARQPYYIVAGVNYGMITETGLIGPDYNYGRADLDVLEPYGVNVIVYVPRKGVYINSNQTAKQVPVSALSKIHIRELVIYLQNEIENMLQNYHWELNTAALRDTIKSKADSILETVKDNGGVYAYRNKCDEDNNTPEIIDNEMIILDTDIEPARGAGKMVQRLTIHKTGGITSVSE